MKSTNQVHQEDANNRTKLQARIAEGELLIPSQAAREAADALSILERVAGAAIALAMMNADQITVGAKNNAGWESLDVETFPKGSQELARLVCNDFLAVFSGLSNDLGKIIGKIKELNQPVPAIFDKGNLQLINSQYKNGPWQIEDAVGSLRNIVGLSGFILSDRTNHQIAHHTSISVSDKLEKAFSKFWDAMHEANLAFCAIESPAAQASGLRRAA